MAFRNNNKRAGRATITGGGYIKVAQLTATFMMFLLVKYKFPDIDAVVGDFIVTSAALMFVLSWMLDMKIFDGYINVVTIPVFAIIVGLIFEILTFPTVDYSYLITNWFSVAVPVIVFIGMGVYLIALFMVHRVKLMGVSTTKLSGLLVTAVLCGLYSFIVGWYLIPMLPVDLNIFS